MPKSCKKDARDWCRTKYGTDWHAVDPPIRKQRLAEAHAALGDAPAKPAKQNPLKPVFQWYEGDPDAYSPHDEDRIYKLKPLALIQGQFVQASKNLWGHPNHPRPPYACFHWRGGARSDDSPDVARCRRPWVGTDFCDYAYESEQHFGPTVADYGDSPETVAEKLLALEHGLRSYTFFDPYMGHVETPVDNDVLVISNLVWRELSPRTRERLLRDSFAKTIYINEPA